jgi:MFS family permease
VLAASGIALAVGVAGASAVALIPGLVLQGVGLGIVLTVNDPVGLNSIDDEDQGEAAGVINTAEQVGGAIGIAGLGALQLGYYFDHLWARVDAAGLHPTPDQIQTVHDFVAEAEQKGLRNVPVNPTVGQIYDDLVQVHADSFRFAFAASAVIAIVGAVACLLLVRRTSLEVPGRVFVPRSRWIVANAGATTPGLTRTPPATAAPDGPPAQPPAP